jgi:hypothetical protein
MPPEGLWRIFLTGLESSDWIFWLDNNKISTSFDPISILILGTWWELFR